ncbi:MAG TPA: hypothetical protein VF400_09980, partial [Anaeromyxobacteraceae bacterium]
MPKRRATLWNAALASLFAVPISLAGCSSSVDPAPTSDAALSALTFSAGTLNPGHFVAATTNYFLV